MKFRSQIPSNNDVPPIPEGGQTQVQSFRPQPQPVYEETDGSDVSVEKGLDDSNSVIVKAYIAAQTNSVTTHVIPAKEGSKVYATLYAAEMAKKPEDRVKPVQKMRNGKPVENDYVKLDESYSLSRLKYLFPKEYEKIAKKNYMRVVLAETKPEFLVVQNLLAAEPDVYSEDQIVRISQRLKQESSAEDTMEGIFIIKKTSLIAYMTAVVSKGIPVLDMVENTDVTKPNGFIISKHRKNTNTGKITYDLVYIKRGKDGIRSKVNTIFELGIPYAINNDRTENKGIVADKAMVVNAETVDNLYAKLGKTLNYSELGTKKDLTKNSGKPEDVLRKEKADCVIQWASKGLGKKFADIGLTKDLVAKLRENHKRSSRTEVPIDTLIDIHNTTLQLYRKQFKKSKAAGK